MLSRQFYFNLNDDLIVDLFAGGGGASTGIELATGRYVDIAVNHDPEAVSMHEMNHPQTKHFCEDVFDVDPVAVTNGRPVGLLWASPDCKHFSKAKGGKPVSKKIRSLAWVVVKWARLVRPRVICLENVEEFQTWGPLVNDMPDPTRKGETFRLWLSELRKLGYTVQFKELRACDYGAPTIRKRFFLVARCDGLPIVFPKPTHGKGLKPYRRNQNADNRQITLSGELARNQQRTERSRRLEVRTLRRGTRKAESTHRFKSRFNCSSYRKFKGNTGGQSISEPDCLMSEMPSKA
jgi:DNA (cytosine-5)-methyltransferase 1